MKRNFLCLFLMLIFVGVFADEFSDNFQNKKWILEYYNEIIYKRDRNLILEKTKKTGNFNMKKILAVLFLFKCITCIFALGFEERINGSKWLAEYYNTVLEKQDRNVLLDFIPKFNEEPFIFHYEKDEGFYWYEDEYLQYGILRISKSNIDNDIILNIQEYPFTMLKINEIEKDCYEIIVEKKFVKQSSSDAAALWGGNLSKITNKEIEKLFFKFDGDYLYIYLDDNKTLFTIYYAYSNEEYLTIRESIKTNSFNMSKITFPRHADGSCDYDTNGNATAASNISNIDEPATESAPAMEHAKSAEEALFPEIAESDSPNKDDVGAKKSSTLPILPIAFGGAASAVLLAIILLAVRKKKAGKK